MSPLLYRVFLMPLTVFFLFLGITASYAQSNDAYVARNISVDVNGTSALDARNKAFVEARRKAYEQLATQILSPADRPNLVVPDDRTITSLIKDIEIVREKMTTRRYAGTVDVRFTPAAVKRTMTVAAAGSMPAQQTQTPPASNTVSGTVSGNDSVSAPAPRAAGTASAPPVASTGMGEDYIYSPKNGGAIRTQTASVPARTASAAPRRILVLPWYGPMGRQTLWTQGNPWRSAWESNATVTREKSTPILLPVGDVEDLRDYSPPQPLSRRGDIDGLLKRYDASEAVLALAEPSETGGVLVSLYRFENGAPVPLGRFGMDNTGANLLNDAVTKAAASLRAMPPVGADSIVSSATPVSVSTPAQNAAVSSQYRTLARFSGLQQWLAMRNALVRVPGVSMVSVQSISPSQAQIEFTYSGEFGSLATLLLQNGMNLAPLPAGAVTSSISGGVQPQYMLTMGRS